MPIKIPDRLPAYETLVSEGVGVMSEAAAIRQDIRPLQIGLLNLMPNKIKTELQMARLIGATPLQVELTLVRIGSHRSKTTPEEHLLAFYQAWEEIRHRRFDGFIVTGAPVETAAYESVSYWRELRAIFDWTSSHAHSTLAVCWGAMAALRHFHDIPKHALAEKTFGVYRQAVLKPASPYLSGFSDDFAVPVSRWAEIRAADISGHAELTLLAHSQETGACLIEDPANRRLYMLDHLEYDSGTLADEYFRDVAAGVPIKLPAGYFTDDDPSQPPQNRWRAHGHLLMSNWINQTYQTTPFDIGLIGRHDAQPARLVEPA